MPYKDILKELAFILGFSVLTAFAVNALSPNGIALFGEWDTSRGVITAKGKTDPVSRDREIQDPETAKKIYDSENAIFVDARAGDIYEQGHIRGALSLPVNRFDEYAFKFMEDYPASTHIVTYCSGRECQDSHELAQYLVAAGYTDVSVFVDGYPAWVERGYPVDE